MDLMYYCSVKCIKTELQEMYKIFRLIQKLAQFCRGVYVCMDVCGCVCVCVCVCEEKKKDRTIYR